MNPSLSQIFLTPLKMEEEWQFFQSIYIDRFPEDERRDFEELKYLAQHNPFFSPQLIKEEEKKVGFITLWHFEPFTFIEHFAIGKEWALKGIGSRALQQIIEQSSLPLCLEAEPPINSLAKRRINFYQRNGFVLLEGDYMQPAYSPQKSPVDLRILSHPKGFPLLSVAEIKKILYKEVYGITQ